VTRTSLRPAIALSAVLLSCFTATFALPQIARAAGAATEAKPQARALTRQAENLLLCGKCDQASPLLEQACAISPGFLRPVGLKGLVCQLKGDDQGALEAYTAMECGTLAGPADQCSVLARLCAEDVLLVNRDRAAHGLVMLRPHPMLALQSTRHCEEMRDMGYFDHESPVAAHATPMERFMELFSFRPCMIGENIAMRRGGDFALKLANVRITHDQLMNSPGHRANILGDKYTDLGVGLAANERGDYWLCEEYVRFVP
jgi:uncharacterized protein YkwD